MIYYLTFFLLLCWFFCCHAANLVEYYNNKKCMLALDGSRKFLTPEGFLTCNANICTPYNDNIYTNCNVCCYGASIKNVNGSWSEWTQTDCLGKCGEGIQVISRSCTSPSPSGSGTMCRLDDESFGVVEIKHEKCNLDKCKNEDKEKFDHCLWGLGTVILIFVLVIATMIYLWRTGKYCFKVQEKHIGGDHYNEKLEEDDMA